MSSVLAIVGIPGAGKTTLSQALSDALHVPTLSTGEALRQLARENKKLADLLADGVLGPEGVVRSLVDDFLLRNHVSILDGYPRHRAQAAHLASVTSELTLVYLDIQHEVAAERVRRRPKRGDDDEDSLRKRLRRDAVGVEEVVNELRDRLIWLNANEPAEALVDRMLRHVRSQES
jgi:adenylate kinase family enzyme